MNNSTLLARRGLRGALETRRDAKVLKTDPICVYDLAERMGVEVRFHCANSFGGMYAKISQTVLVPSLRPAGRRAFTCAHELGHWYFNHGDRVDQFESIDKIDNENPDERLVNIYASYLLMPSWVVADAFNRRGLNPQTCSPENFYLVSCQLGVGYETLIQHSFRSLNLIPSYRATDLLKITPKEIKSMVLGNMANEGHLIIADPYWNAVPIDLQVGDRAILPKGIVLEGTCVTPIASCPLGQVVEGHAPGIGRAESKETKWSVFMRVSRKDFEGRSVYRHLEDPDLE